MNEPTHVLEDPVAFEEHKVLFMGEVAKIVGELGLGEMREWAKGRCGSSTWAWADLKMRVKAGLWDFAICRDHLSLSADEV